MNELILRTEELETNPTPRVAVALVLDSSYSMSGDLINELNEGVAHLFNSLKEHPIASQAAELAVVSFGAGGVSVLENFRGVEYQSAPKLIANGVTPMGEAVNDALDMLEQRKSEYKNSGIDYYQPWLIVISDGEPTDSISSAVSRSVQLESQKKLAVFPIGVGEDAAMKELSRFSGKKPALKLKGIDFITMFEWLSNSIVQVSQSTPGDTIPLDVDGLKSWAEI
jgi:uncharacterized protein YegL